MSGGLFRFPWTGLLRTTRVQQNQVNYFPLTGTVQMDGSAIGGYVSVTDYGAVGNGVVDDTDAIQQALEHAASSDPPTAVYVPPGTYQCTGLDFPPTLRALFGAGSDISIFRRIDSAPSTAPVLAASSCSNFVIADIGFDGNKANQTLGANTLQISTSSDFKLFRCHAHNAKAASGYGSGIVLNLSASTNPTGREISLIDCESYDNDAQGLSILRTGAAIAVHGGVYSDNGGGGITYTNQGQAPVADSVPRLSIADVRAEYNTGVGISVSGFLVVGLGGVLTYGHGSDPVQGLIISGCQCNYNTSYGIFAQATGVAITGNTTRFNGDAAQAGICANAQNVVISNNIVTDNPAAFGIDAGGSFYGTISGNQVQNNGDPGTSGTGINLGACQHVVCQNNVLKDNGVNEIYLTRNDSGTHYFPWDANDVVIDNNIIINTLSSSRYAIQTSGLPDNIMITDNRIEWPDVDGFTAIRGGIMSGVIKGNTLSGAVGHTQNAAASLSIPDWADVININTDTVPIIAILTASQSGLAQKLAACVVTARGTGYTADFDVAVSGGGGAGATVRAKVTQDGRVAALIVTAAGSGYTSVPALDLSAGAGTGATATAHVGVPLWAGSELVLAAFGSQFRITSGSVINLPAPVGTTITVAAQGNLTLRTLAARWFPLAMASGNGNVYPTSIILNNGPTHTAGAGAPGTTEPKGSTFQRTDGGVGTTLYVSQGGGTWNPVAGV